MSTEENQNYIDEQLLRRTIKRDYEEGCRPSTTKEHTWKQIQMQLGKPSKKKQGMFYNKKLLSIASVFLVLIISSLFIQLKDGEAFGWFSNYFVQQQGNSTEIKTQISDEPIEMPDTPPSYDEPLQSEELVPVETDMSLEEAVEQTSFHIVTPSTLPKGYQLDYVTLQKYEGAPLEQVFLHYQGGDASFVIEQEKIIGEFYANNTTVNNDHAKVETVDLNGTDASLITYDDGTVELIWIRLRTEIRMRGQLSEKEIIKTAKSLH